MHTAHRGLSKAAVVLVVLIVVIIAGGAAYEASVTISSGQQSTTLPHTTTQTSQSTTTQTSLSVTSSTNTTFAGPQTPVDLELTDPPEVPAGTTSLNMTYTSLTLLVGVPGPGGTLTPTPVNFPAASNSNTLELLRLQNVSQTLSLTKLPNDSVVYSATFDVAGVAVVINGTAYPVSLATGTSSFLVAIANPAAVMNDNTVMFQLNPDVVLTPSGYQMIPSAVGLMQNGALSRAVGVTRSLSSTYIYAIAAQQGKSAVSLLSMSASGNSTSMVIRVSNTGNVTFAVVAFGVSGNFVSNPACASSGGATAVPCKTLHYPDNVWFLLSPPSASAAAGQCIKTTMNAATGIGGTVTAAAGIELGPGQCIEASFSGVISINNVVFVPVVNSGSVFRVRLVADLGASIRVACTAPFGATPCVPSKEVPVTPPPPVANPIRAKVAGKLTLANETTAGPTAGVLSLTVTNTGTVTITSEIALVSSSVAVSTPPTPVINSSVPVAPDQTVTVNGTIANALPNTPYTVLATLRGSDGASHSYRLRVGSLSIGKRSSGVSISAVSLVVGPASSLFNATLQNTGQVPWSVISLLVGSVQVPPTACAQAAAAVVAPGQSTSCSYQIQHVYKLGRTYSVAVIVSGTSGPSSVAHTTVTATGVAFTGVISADVTANFTQSTTAAGPGLLYLSLSNNGTVTITGISVSSSSLPSPETYRVSLAPGQTLERMIPINNLSPGVAYTFEVAVSGSGLSKTYSLVATAPSGTGPPTSSGTLSASATATLTVLNGTASSQGMLTLQLTNNGTVVITGVSVALSGTGQPTQVVLKGLSAHSHIQPGASVRGTGPVPGVVAGSTYTLTVTIAGQGGALKAYTLTVVAQAASTTP